MKENKKMIIATAIGLGLIILIGISFALYTITIKGTTTQTIKIGKLEVVLSNELNAINLDNAFPVNDDRGQKNPPYTFTLENNASPTLDYKIKLIEDTIAKDACTGCSFISPSDIRFSLVKNSDLSQVGGVPLTNIISQGEIIGREKINFSLKIWIANTATNTQNKYFYGKIEVDAVQK